MIKPETKKSCETVPLKSLGPLCDLLAAPERHKPGRGLRQQEPLFLNGTWVEEKTLVNTQ